jgi:hypothetical protein
MKAPPAETFLATPMAASPLLLTPSTRNVAPTRSWTRSSEPGLSSLSRTSIRPLSCSFSWRTRACVSLKRQNSGKFHIPRKVGNSFLGQGTVFRHCPLCRSLYLRLWLTRRPCVRLFLRATRARSVPVLFRSGVRSGLYLRACRAQSADDYAHTRTVPASPDPLAHGRSPAAVAERS